MKKLILLTMLLFFTLPAFAANKPSLDEMIGQMVLIGFHGTKTTDPEVATTLEHVKKGKIGGIMLLGYNIENPQQMDNLIKEFKAVQPKGKPLFIAVDQEGGAVQRLKASNGFKDYPSAEDVANTETPEQAYNEYLEMATTLKTQGINWNFGPDVDVNINPNCPVIGKKGRSFSSNPQSVAIYAEKFVDAHRKAGVFTTLKHFPGHGSSVSDTHLGIADVTNTWTDVELTPYKELIKKNKADSIMPAHIFNKNMDKMYPASLSPKIVQGILVKKLGYKGLIITDDLQMGAIREYYSFDDTVINAVKAGNDMLLFSNYFKSDMEIPEKTRKALEKAVKNGTISRKRLEQSYNKIIAAKKAVS